MLPMRVANDISAFAVNIETGALTSVPGSPFAAGTHPSALTLYAGILTLYVANAGSNTISAFAIDANDGGAHPTVAGDLCHGPRSLLVDGGSHLRNFFMWRVAGVQTTFPHS